MIRDLALLVVVLCVAFTVTAVLMLQNQRKGRQLTAQAKTLLGIKGAREQLDAQLYANEITPEEYGRRIKLLMQAHPEETA